MNTQSSEVSEVTVPEAEIARRAYEIWQSRGCPPGDGSEDWQAAKAELIAARVSRNGPEGRGLLRWLRRIRKRTQT